jgi:hypothetical protein
MLCVHCGISGLSSRIAIIKSLRRQELASGKDSVQLTGRLILGFVLIGALSATLAIPEACAAQNLWAWVKKEQRHVTSSQSVASNASLSGNFVFSIGIYNPGPRPLSDARIAFTSVRPPESLIANTWGIGPIPTESYTYLPTDGAYRYTWAMPVIYQKSSQQVWLNTPIRCTFTPGFDSSREVTPTLLESESDAQQIRIRVKPIQPFRALNVGVSLEGSDYVRVELVKGSDKPLLRDASRTYLYWWVDNPQVNEVYEFSVRLRLANLIFPSRVHFVPWTEVMAYESQRVNAWPSSAWHGTVQPDPDLSVWDVTVQAPGNSNSKLALEVARTVRYLGSSTAQLKTSIAVRGLPFTQSSSLYIDKNGAKYNLEIDGASTEFTRITGSVRSVTAWLSEGTAHDIRVPKAIEVDSFTRYYCEENSVALSASHVEIASLQIRSFSHAFNYVKQFLLRFDSWAEGNHTAEWFDAGSTVTVEVQPFAVPDDVSLLFWAFGFRYRFSGWNGTADRTSPIVSFVLEKPMNITALWSEDYSQILPRVGITAVFMGLIALALLALLVTWKTAPGVDFDLLLQRLETLKASGAISESAYARLKSEYERRKRRP